MTADQIKVAIADDHKIFRDGIKMALRDKEYLKILWEAEDGKDLMHKLKIKMPDVILMDIRMPEVDGINAISLIRKEYEALKIIVLTMYDDQEMITKMMEMGANAYLTKTTEPEEIYQAILTCMNDDFYFNDLVNKAVLLKLQHKKKVRQFYPNPVKLSEKEIKIIIHTCKYRLIYFFGVGCLCQVCIGAHLHHLSDHFLVIVHSKDNYLQCFIFLPDKADGIDSVYFRHPDIHQYYIRHLDLQFMHQIFSIFSLPKYFQVFLIS